MLQFRECWASTDWAVTEKKMADLAFNYTEEANRVEAALRKEFPQDTIDTTQGYNGRVHVKVVSRRFNGKTEPEKQQMLWEILNRHLEADAQAVSLALAFGTDEL
jgi:stress-induced morphogen